MVSRVHYRDLENEISRLNKEGYTVTSSMQEDNDYILNYREKCKIINTKTLVKPVIDYVEKPVKRISSNKFMELFEKNIQK